MAIETLSASPNIIDAPISTEVGTDSKASIIDKLREKTKEKAQLVKRALGGTAMKVIDHYAEPFRPTRIIGQTDPNDYTVVPERNHGYNPPIQLVEVAPVAAEQSAVEAVTGQPEIEAAVGQSVDAAISDELEQAAATLQPVEQSGLLSPEIVDAYDHAHDALVKALQDVDNGAATDKQREAIFTSADELLKNFKPLEATLDNDTSTVEDSPAEENKDTDDNDVVGDIETKTDKDADTIKKVETITHVPMDLQDAMLLATAVEKSNSPELFDAVQKMLLRTDGFGAPFGSEFIVEAFNVASHRNSTQVMKLAMAIETS